MRMQQDSTYEKSSMVKVIALCPQPIYYLNKTWHMSMSPYAVTRPYWANFVENAVYLPVYLVCAVPYNVAGLPVKLQDDRTILDTNLEASRGHLIGYWNEVQTDGQIHTTVVM